MYDPPLPPIPSPFPLSPTPYLIDVNSVFYFHRRWENDNSGGGPVDVFQLFKEVQRMGGKEAVSGGAGWEKLASNLGHPNFGREIRQVYSRYLGDFEVSKYVAVGTDLIEAASSLRGVESTHACYPSQMLTRAHLPLLFFVVRMYMVCTEIRSSCP